MKPPYNGPIGVYEMAARRTSQVREKYPHAAIIRCITPGLYRIFGTTANAGDW